MSLPPEPAAVASLSQQFVLVCDAAGTITWIDDSARLRGFAPRQLLADHALDGSRDKLARLLAAAATDRTTGCEIALHIHGKPATYVFAAQPDGDRGHILVVGNAAPEHLSTAIGSTSEALSEVVGLNREIATQKRELQRRHDEAVALQHELRDSNRGILHLHRELEDRADALRHSSDVKSRVVSSVSHEFRTPLHSILGLTQLLLDDSDGELGDEQRKQVRFIRASAEELIALVNDLLDLSRIEAGKVSLRAETFTLSDFFGSLRGSVRPLLPTDSKIALEIDDVPDDIRLETDRAKLSQILRNLIANALKFTEAGRVTVRARRDADDLEIAVTDTGIGIPPDQLDRIFEEFGQVDSPIQRRTTGSGLGLPISRKIAELLGGTITVTSTPGEGSAFVVRIPLVHGDVAGMHEVEARSRTRDPDRSPVLVVEDDRRTIFVYERYLAMAGYQVMPARNIADARRILAETRPVAIVLDIMLEEETTWAFLADVKRDPATSDIPVLVVTVTNREAKARALGADEFWLKPIDQDRLLSRLKGLVRPPAHSRILVIDDDERARYLVRKHLQGSPYELFEASTSTDGVSLARQHMPQVILLDFLLENATAFDVLDELKADPRTRGIPVIIVTSQVLDATDRTRLEAGTEAVISKDSLTRELAIHRIRDALSRGGIGSQSR